MFEVASALLMLPTLSGEGPPAQPPRVAVPLPEKAYRASQRTYLLGCGTYKLRVIMNEVRRREAAKRRRHDPEE